MTKLNDLAINEKRPPTNNKSMEIETKKTLLTGLGKKSPRTV